MEISAPPTYSAAIKILKDYYGFDTFRLTQEKIILDLVAGIDLLVLMPTGGGKSLCYQIPSMIRTGVGIVVSPLIALMEDQVSALKLQGIRAAYYNSSLSKQEANTVLSQLHEGRLDLLYVAPERLVSPSFLERIKSCPLALFAIDEAHCISQWGHDFRPEYATLSLLKQHFPNVPIIALTATADKQTQKDIIKKLQYQPKHYIASFNRPNIHYSVIAKHNPIKQICHFLDEQRQQSGIIYCTTRKSVEQVAEKLQALGKRARAYHAGLSHQERREVQTLFRYDNIDIVVATIAFGMGIDKPNVRFVIHYDLPKTIEHYYQETGRAGRDGLAAQALLLYNPADSAKLRALIATMDLEEAKRIENYKLNHILAFAEATCCRRQILLRYFGELYEEQCGLCDVCDTPPQLVDVTEEAQKFLSCIYRLKQSYGLAHVVEVLRGSNAEKIQRVGHHRLSTFGIGQEKPTAFWKHLAWQLIHRDYCFQDLDHYQVLRLTSKAIPLLRGEEKISLSIQYITAEKTQVKGKTSSKQAFVSSPLFEQLRSLRKQIAMEEDKPPFMIFSDATLQDMVRIQPRNMEEFLTVSGVGQYKLTQYGASFLKAIKEFCAQNCLA